MLKSLSKPMQIALMAVLALVAWFAVSPMLSPQDPPKPAAKTASKSSAKKDNQLYTDADTKAKPSDFDPIAAPLKNAFVPIIKGGAGTGSKSSQVNVVPPEFAGGEANWTYTGSAQIDGVLEALLQNNTTGDNVFLKAGDTWKGISVEEVTDDSLVLSSPEMGETKTLELPPDVVTSPAAGPGGFAPQSPLRGNIGPMAIQPDPTGGAAAAQDPNGGLPNNGALPNGFGGNGFGGGGGGGRRGGRRGGGRGSGGGGGGG